MLLKALLQIWMVVFLVICGAAIFLLLPGVLRFVGVPMVGVALLILLVNRDLLLLINSRPLIIGGIETPTRERKLTIEMEMDPRVIPKRISGTVVIKPITCEDPTQNPICNLIWHEQL